MLSLASHRYRINLNQEDTDSEHVSMTMKLEFIDPLKKQRECIMLYSST